MGFKFNTCLQYSCSDLSLWGSGKGEQHIRQQDSGANQVHIGGARRAGGGAACVGTGAPGTPWGPRQVIAPLPHCCAASLLLLQQGFQH